MGDKRWHILFAEPYDHAAVALASDAGRVTILAPDEHPSLSEKLVDCDALLIRTGTRVTEALLANAPKLKVIGRAGSGLDHIDLDAVKRRGIVVVHTPDAATDAAADLTVGMILSLVRQLRFMDDAVRGGRFDETRKKVYHREMHELVLGVIGLGRIGRAVARRCRRGFDMRILYNDIVSPGWLDFVAEPKDKTVLYREADVITLHVPLTEQTRELIDGKALAEFKEGALLVNASRGAVVDGEAVAAALQTGKLGGTALDVFDPEPLPKEHPLLKAPNTLFTPHIGARTTIAQARMNAVIEDVLAVLQGKAPRYRVALPEG